MIVSTQTSQTLSVDEDTQEVQRDWQSLMAVLDYCDTSMSYGCHCGFWTLLFQSSSLLIHLAKEQKEPQVDVPPHPTYARDC